MKGDCGKKHNIALHSTCFAASCETSCTICYKVVLVSQAKGLANFTINCILYVYKHLKKTFDICDLNVPYGLPFSNRQPYIPHPRREFAPPHGNKKYSAHRSQLFKNFLIRLTSSVQKFFSPVQPHPFKYIFLSAIHLFKNFHHLFIVPPHLFEKFSSFVHLSAAPFQMAQLSVSHPFTCRVFICKECFRVRGHTISILRKNKNEVLDFAV